METRQLHVRDLSTVTGIQQYEHCVQSIFFLGLEDFEGSIYLSLESDKFSEDVALTNNTFIIGQPMTKFNVTYTCQIYGIVGTGEKIQLSKQFRMVIYKSNNISGEAGEYPIDPNIVNGIDQYITTKESEIDDYVDQVIDRIPADYATLEQSSYNAYPTESESGNPIYIDDGAEDIPVKELIVNLEPKQSGTGDSSPTNVRPISGYDSVNVTVNEEVYSITFPSSVGTVYGGTLNVTTGELVVDRYKMTVDGSKIPSITPLTDNYRIGIMNIAQLFNAPFAKYNGNNTVAIGNWLPKRTQGYSEDTTGFYFYSYTAIYVFFPKSLIASHDLELARQYFIDNPLEICYELETPITYQLSPTEISTLLGNNTIACDGTTIDLKYRADTTMVIEKLTNAIVSMGGNV